MNHEDLNERINELEDKLNSKIGWGELIGVLVGASIVLLVFLV